MAAASSSRAMATSGFSSASRAQHKLFAEPVSPVIATASRASAARSALYGAVSEKCFLRRCASGFIITRIARSSPQPAKRAQLFYLIDFMLVHLDSMLVHPHTPLSLAEPFSRKWKWGGNQSRLHPQREKGQTREARRMRGITRTIYNLIIFLPQIYDTCFLWESVIEGTIGNL